MHTCLEQSLRSAIAKLDEAAGTASTPLGCPLGGSWETI